MKEINLKQWINNWKDGMYDKRDVDTMCEAGWYDWFCNDNSLYSRLKKLAPKVIWFSDLGIIDPEKVYVFFKNNCPLVGELYDDFRICDLYNDNNVIFTIVPKSGHRNAKKPAELWGINPDTGKFEELLTAKNWSQLKKKIIENIEFLKRSAMIFHDRFDGTDIYLKLK